MPINTDQCWSKFWHWSQCRSIPPNSSHWEEFWINSVIIIIILIAIDRHWALIEGVLIIRECQLWLEGIRIEPSYFSTGKNSIYMDSKPWKGGTNGDGPQCLYYFWAVLLCHWKMAPVFLQKKSWNWNIPPFSTAVVFGDYIISLPDPPFLPTTKRGW